MAIVVLHFLCFKIISLVGVVVYNQPEKGLQHFPYCTSRELGGLCICLRGLLFQCS